MSKKKLTPWIPGRRKPARIGVYMATIMLDPDESRGLYRYWDGLHWCKPARDPGDAARPQNMGRAIFHIQFWRGLAQEPKQARQS